MKTIIRLSLTELFLACSYFTNAQDQAKVADSTKKATKELPLEPERNIRFSTDKGTWMSVDVHPNGDTIIFDMMGDLYTLPMAGGKATRLTEGMPYDVHPRYSPDGKSIVFISDKSGSDNVWTMDLDTKTQKQLTEVETKLNNRPRKRFGFENPIFVMDNLLFNQKVAFVT